MYQRDGDSAVHVAYNIDSVLVKLDQNCYKEVKLESKETTFPTLLKLPLSPASSSFKKKKKGWISKSILRFPYDFPLVQSIHSHPLIP